MSCVAVPGDAASVNNDQGVGSAAVEGDLRFVLSQPLERLIARDQQVLIPEAQGWDIPESGWRALRELGLPRLPLFTSRPQSSRDPVLVPNLASTYERRFIERGRRLYDLGFWGPSEESFVVGVVPGDGRVLCLLPEPITVEDIPEVLRPHHAGLHTPAEVLQN
ncbi:hypothetical protein ACFXAW_10655 [Streptomyces sp. NPDC059445]|uniref:hypothetical protein n=1 Tax=Streptomyces sp. NPDC059445 TaxID=3346832 RepID=UPI0036ADCB09